MLVAYILYTFTLFESPFFFLIFIFLFFLKLYNKIMSETHDHAEKDSFEPLKQEYYEGKHLSAPVKEIEVNKIISIFLSLSLFVNIYLLSSS